jgi:organic radical activating enzyme
MSIVVKNRASEPDHLRITEIFLSIQGEAAQVGWPTVFVRLTGCPLTKYWLRSINIGCDTYA